jgi:deoxyribonuclease V
MSQLAVSWPDDPEDLAALQHDLAAATPPSWRPPADRPILVGGCFCCFPRGVEGSGEAGDEVWAAAVTVADGRRVAARVQRGRAGAPYVAGQLARREGVALEAVVRALPVRPDVLLVNATGRDHPRRAGLAVHLGAVLDLPTVGVTHRPLLASGAWPEDTTGSSSPIVLDGEVVGAWLRTRATRRPLVVHAGWRTTPDVAVEVVRLATRVYRTPLPLREARQLARRDRSRTRRSAS